MAADNLADYRLWLWREEFINHGAVPERFSRSAGCARRIVRQGLLFVAVDLGDQYFPW